MSDERYFCNVCDIEFKNNNGLTIHTNKSKAHAKRAQSLGTMPPEAPDEAPEPEVTFPDQDWTPAEPAEDGFADRAPDLGVAPEVMAQEVAGVIDELRVAGEGDDQIVVPFKQWNENDREVLGGRPNRRLTVGLRTLKMLAPRCDEHNDGIPGWWYRCEQEGHDPYKWTTERTSKERILSSEPDAQGRYRVIGTEDVVYYSITHNTRQLPFTGKHNGGLELSQARGKGWRLPEERGVAPFCQFYNCWIQNPKFSTPYGDYCGREQAQLVAAEYTETFLFVNDGTQRARQLAALGI